MWPTDPNLQLPHSLLISCGITINFVYLERINLVYSKERKHITEVLICKVNLNYAYVPTHCVDIMKDMKFFSKLSQKTAIVIIANAFSKLRKNRAFGLSVLSITDNHYSFSWFFP